MFNLEQAIAEWRQNMLACGIETPVPLEELELHLREEIERLVGKGIFVEQVVVEGKFEGSAQIGLGERARLGRGAGRPAQSTA